MRDLCLFAELLRMLPGDSPLRAHLLSNERIGESSWLLYAYEEPGGTSFDDPELFREAAKAMLGIPMGLGQVGQVLRCSKKN